MELKKKYTGLGQEMVRRSRQGGGLSGLALIAVTALVVSCSGTSPPADAVLSDPQITLVRVPEGGIQPQAGLDRKGRLHLIYLKGEPGHADIFYTHSDDFGASFTAPKRVNSEPESAIAAGTVRGPHLALGRNGLVHVAWMGSSQAGPKAPGDKVPMLYTRLNGDGSGFEPQRNLIQTKPGLDGGGTIAADATGKVYVAWHAPENYPGTEADRRIWVAVSQDDGRSFSIEAAADADPAGVCACCGIRAALDLQGYLLLAYRSAAGTGTRDVRLLTSQNGRIFKEREIHQWEVEHCMMSTFDFHADEEGSLMAWETEEQIHFGILEPQAAEVAKRAFAPGTGDNRKHPALARNSRGEILLAWAEGTRWARGGRVAWQVFDRDLQPLPGQAGAADELPVWSRPAAVATPSGDFVLLY